MKLARRFITAIKAGVGFGIVALVMPRVAKSIIRHGIDASLPEIEAELHPPPPPTIHN